MREKKRQTVLRKRVVSSVTTLAVVLSSLYVPQGTIKAYADEAAIAVEVDSQSTYRATQIVNGNFETRPWESYIYNGITYTAPDKTVTGNISAIPNEVGKGWNTTEIRPYDGSLFEVWSVKGDLHGETTDFSNNGDYFIEMNANNSAALYQDLYTNGGDVIKWTLQHADRAGHGFAEQRMYVIIGAPEKDDNGNIIPATGVNTNIETKIQPTGMAEYRYNGITAGADKDNPENSIAFANIDDLSGLSVKKGTSKWCDVAGIYVIPEGQNVTRFAFCADASSKVVTSETPDQDKWISGGNFLDNITFSTLIGNLQATKQPDKSIKIIGYWGDEDEIKKLIVQFSGTEKQIDMSSVRKQNFVITIPASIIGDATSVKIYHEDYQSAARTIDIKHGHAWNYEGGTGENANKIYAYCTNEIQASECSYYGAEHKLTITLNATDATYSGSPYSGASVTNGILGDVVEDIQYYSVTEEGTETLLDTAPTNVGNYKAKVTKKVSDTESYTAEKSFTIYKKPLTDSMVTPATSTLYYTGEEIQAPEVIVSDKDENGKEAITPQDYRISGNESHTVPGTYTITVTASENGNYSGSAKTTWTIDIGDFPENAVKAEPYQETYDGKAHGIKVTIPEGASITYSDTEDGTYSTECPSYIDAATEAHTVYYKVEKYGYNTVKDSATVKIDPKPLTAVVKAENKTYDGTTETEVTATIETGITGETITITGLKGNFTDADAGINKTVTIDDEQKNINITGGKLENYEIIIPDTATADIAPKQLTDAMLNITGDKEYNGNEIVQTITVNDDGGRNLTEGTDYTVTIDSTVSAVNCGTYKITIEGKGNYTGIVFKEWKITTTKLMGITSQDVNVTYDGKAKTIAISGVEGMTISYKTATDGTYTSEKPSFISVGEYTIYYKVEKDANYQPLEGSASVIIKVF